MDTNQIKFEQLKKLLSEFQKKYDHAVHDANVAKARFYDIINVGREEPSDVELKARIVYLECELNKVIAQRDKFKTRLYSLGTLNQIKEE